MIRNRRLIVQLLSLAFLFAQLGMAVHASMHLKAEPHGAPAQVCGQCASFAPLQNMVGGQQTADGLLKAVQAEYEQELAQ